MYLGLCGIWVHDAVLAGDLFAITALVRCLLVTVFLQLLLEAGLELTDLAVFDVVVAAANCIGFEELDLVLDTCVEDLCLCDDGLKRATRRCIGAGKRSLVCGGDTANLLSQGANIGLDSFDSGQKVLVRQDIGSMLHWDLSRDSGVWRTIVILVKSVLVRALVVVMCGWWCLSGSRCGILRVQGLRRVL